MLRRFRSREWKTWSKKSLFHVVGNTKTKLTLEAGKGPPGIRRGRPGGNMEAFSVPRREVELTAPVSSFDSVGMSLGSWQQGGVFLGSCRGGFFLVELS